MSEQSVTPTATGAQETVTATEVTPAAGTQPANTGGTAYRSFTNKADFDAEAARIRTAAERDAKARLLKAMGLSEEAQVADTAEELRTLRERSATLTVQTETQEYTIAVLRQKPSASPEEIRDIVRMARGLQDDQTDMAAAVTRVLTMTGGTAPAPALSTAPPVLPQGVAVVQPENATAGGGNPFAKGTPAYNQTEQARLYREDRERAVRLAKEAGVEIK